MLKYRRLDKFLCHQVWLIEVRDFEGFQTEERLDYDVFLTKRSADRWLHDRVFSHMTELGKVSEI